MLPQLRIRTEFSYREAFGPIDAVADRLAAIGCPAAGIVDTAGTWGHVLWEKALRERDIAPLFGTEFRIATETGRKPSCWVLATDRAAFYRLSSSPPESPRDLAGVPGVIRFAGAALTDPETFDYIDVNPRSIRRTMAALELHRKTGKPLVITSDNDYPAPEDRERFLAWNDSKKMTPQHILSDQEIEEALLPILGKKLLTQAAQNCHDIWDRCRAVKLEAAPMIHVEGDLHAEVEAGRQYRLERGHIPEWTDEYQARLDRELELIHEKDYESYFLVVSDMIKWAKERMLVGPGRGSSAGSLVCFLMEITEVDPLVHNLIFERFIDVNRNDLPDIDVDFNDQKRELVFDYLAERYGRENVARIGSVNRLKPRSVVAHVAKKMDIPHGATFPVLNVLIEYSSGDSRYGNGLADTLTNTQPGREFMQRYPEASIMGELENHASHSGQHAAGIIVSNVPVIEYCTVRDGIAHIDKKDAEYLNLLKIDALGLRTLGVIEDTGCVTPQELYDLKFDDPKCFDIFNEAKFSGVFQFEGAAQRRVSVVIPVKSFDQIDHITALARPGPLGGGATTSYTRRNNGAEAIEYRHPSMSEYLGDTLGVVLYQEQVMRIVRELGQFSWSDTSMVRKGMSASKGKEYFDAFEEQFVEGAANNGLSEDEARHIWQEICNFGSWGMNRSHTVSYAMISYWCAYMKAYYPLEYAASCLRHAKDDEQTVEVLRELNKEGVEFIPFDIDLSAENWAAVDGKLVGGFENLVGIGPVKARYFLNKRDTEGLSEKDREKLAKHKPKHNDLHPTHTRWQHIYDDPDAHNVHGPIKEFDELENWENAVVICRLVRMDRRDYNERMLVAKRGSEMSGQTLFLDAFMVDDSISKPARVRLKSEMWNAFGEKMADRAVAGEDYFLVRGKWLSDFSMMICKKIKCLTNPEMFK